MSHSPIDDMEASIWVILWEFYGQGHSNLTRPQLNWFEGLGSDNLTSIAYQKKAMMLQPRHILPQCPPASQFAVSVLNMVNDLQFDVSITEDHIETFYKQYLRSFAECVRSNHPTLQQDWATVFGITTKD